MIEDSDHTAHTVRCVLDFFHPHLEVGDYFAVEDGIVESLGIAAGFDGGPNLAVAQFMQEHPGAYEIDRSLCDFYGRNYTFNTDGYLRRTKGG